MNSLSRANHVSEKKYHQQKQNMLGPVDILPPPPPDPRPFHSVYKTKARCYLPPHLPLSPPRTPTPPRSRPPPPSPFSLIIAAGGSSGHREENSREDHRDGDKQHHPERYANAVEQHRPDFPEGLHRSPVRRLLQQRRPKVGRKVVHHVPCILLMKKQKFVYKKSGIKRRKHNTTKKNKNQAFRQRRFSRGMERGEAEQGGRGGGVGG